MLQLAPIKLGPGRTCVSFTVVDLRRDSPVVVQVTRPGLALFWACRRRTVPADEACGAPICHRGHDVCCTRAPHDGGLHSTPDPVRLGCTLRWSADPKIHLREGWQKDWQRAADVWTEEEHTFDLLGFAVDDRPAVLKPEHRRDAVWICCCRVGDDAAQLLVVGQEKPGMPVWHPTEVS